MIEIKCPEVYTPFQGDTKIFAGGGITGCPNWQNYLVNKIHTFSVKSDSLRIFNPRRNDFNILDTDETKKQILWEHNHLELSDAIIFWFPKDTLCPITLFELGKYAKSDKHLFVGCDPEYARRVDVIEQLALIRPGIVVANNLDSIIHEIMYYTTY